VTHICKENFSYSHSASEKNSVATNVQYFFCCNHDVTVNKLVKRRKKKVPMQLKNRCNDSAIERKKQLQSRYNWKIFTSNHLRY
jgi:hypothetical protein